jgi:Fic family protein
MPDGDRHSQADEPELLLDQDAIAHRESRNTLRQFDAVAERIEYWLEPERPFRLRPSIILELNRIALDGLSATAGAYRPAGVTIQGSKHQPPDAFRVPELLEELCDYVNDNWETASPIHLAAYVMWRLNWIHPFTDGNGRTSRAVSYLVLCVKLGYRLPGSKTIPDLIVENKTPYYEALEAADHANSQGVLNLGALETLLGSRLASQLAHVLNSAKKPKA